MIIQCPRRLFSVTFFPLTRRFLKANFHLTPPAIRNPRFNSEKHLLDDALESLG
jgi:hypothetical protein